MLGPRLRPGPYQLVSGAVAVVVAGVPAVAVTAVVAAARHRRRLLLLPLHPLCSSKSFTSTTYTWRACSMLFSRSHLTSPVACRSCSRSP